MAGERLGFDGADETTEGLAPNPKVIYRISDNDRGLKLHSYELLPRYEDVDRFLRERWKEIAVNGEEDKKNQRILVEGFISGENMNVLELERDAERRIIAAKLVEVVNWKLKDLLMDPDFNDDIEELREDSPEDFELVSQMLGIRTAMADPLYRDLSRSRLEIFNSKFDEMSEDSQERVSPFLRKIAGVFS